MLKSRYRNAILVTLLICLLVLPSLLVMGCNDKKGSDKNSKVGTSSDDKASKDAGSDKEANGEDDETQTATSDSNSGSQNAAVELIALNYAKEKNPSLTELKVIKSKTIDEWACVDLEPVDKSADRARVLLKSKGGGWEVIAFGLVLPEDYPDVPAELFE